MRGILSSSRTPISAEDASNAEGEKSVEATRIKRIVSLLGFSLSLSSCRFLWTETPAPFSGLVFHQGAYRFSFGSEKELFIKSVPGKSGGRAEIVSVDDDFYTDRGFLLYICSLEGDPGKNWLYKYDYKTGDSDLVTAISAQEEPKFFALDNTYSPGFFVDGEDGCPHYAFLGENEEIVDCGVERPYYACRWGYAALLPKSESDSSFVYEEDKRSVFRFFDGEEVPMQDGGRVVSAGENNVLFFVSRYDDRLAQYDKTTGRTTIFEGEYSSLPWVHADRYIASSRHYTQTPYLWKHDYRTSAVTIVYINDGSFTEYYFSYPSLQVGGFDQCEWVVHTDTFLVSAGNAQRDRRLRIDLRKNTIEEIPSKGSGRVVTFSTFDRIALTTEHYELIERYQPTNGSSSYRNCASYYVRELKTGAMTLVQQALGGPLLSFQKAMEAE